MYNKVVFILGALLALSSASVLVKSIGNLRFQEDLSSCAGRCNVSGTIPEAPCQCNLPCQSFGDCCPDYAELCLGGGEQGSCAGKCDTVGTDPNAPCQCNKPCVDFGDCCPDYEDVCGATGGPITNAELAALSEELLALDTENNVASLVTLNLQGNPLLTVDPSAYTRNTISKLTALHDNYVADTDVAEDVTPEEIAEENAFIDAIFETPIMQKAQEFLIAKGLPNGKQNFHDIWFGLYSRGALGSSGLEHILLGELNNGVSGFHNWIYYAKEEEAGNMVFNSYSDTTDLGDYGSILEFSFKWRNQNKPIGSMYIGTSPEFELAINTVCWYARPNSKCPVVLNGQSVGIQTYDINCSGKKCVASAYPDLSD